jgi:serine/threonine-protein kinase
VIVDESDHAKVTDFGIARAGASDMTETGSIMGTAQYLSPEQAQGHAVSASSDLYAIGVVLYELLTGRVPFDAETAVTIALKHVSEAPTAPTAINPTIPTELEQVVMWALNKNPADRPANADQFLNALEDAKAAILARARGERTISMPALAGIAGAGAAASGGRVVPAAAVAPPPTVRESPGDGAPALLVEPPPPPPDDRRLWPWLALLLVLLLAAGGIAAYLLTRPTKKVVPEVVGQTLNTARTVLQNDGFAVSVLPVTSDKPAGTVIGEDPQGGTKANQGATIALTVSQGPGSTTVPSVKGLPLKKAEQLLAKAQLKIGRVISQSSDQVPAGEVVDTDPAAGATPTAGTSVTVFVSSGKPRAAVPDVTGQREGAAKASLKAAGFTIGTVTRQTTTSVPDGEVISQSPQGNTQAIVGSPVNLVVAKAPPTANVPSVKGQTTDAARRALIQAGFVVAEQDQAVTDPAQNDRVQSQSPAAGKTAKKGSTVTIFVGKYRTRTTTTTTTTATTTASTATRT